jgi:hypothetical protein
MLREALHELLLMADHGAKTRWRVVRNLPELNMAVFAFLLNFVWEMLQIPFFRGMTEGRHWDAVLICTQATLGDVGITLIAFWIIAWLGGRTWPLRPSAAQIVGFTALGLIATMAFELLATKVWDLWSYSELMPVIPILEVGLIPLLQWMVLPPLIVWFVHRQLTRES